MEMKYIHDVENGICYGWRLRPALDDTSIVAIMIAYCNREDQYEKSKAREVIKNKFIVNDCIFVPFISNQCLSVESVISQVYRHMISLPNEYQYPIDGKKSNQTARLIKSVAKYLSRYNMDYPAIIEDELYESFKSDRRGLVAPPVRANFHTEVKPELKYIHVNNGSRAWSYTVAFRVLNYYDTYTADIEYACAWCNPHDNYEKSIGRHIAAARLDESPILFTANIKDPMLIRAEVLDDISSRGWSSELGIPKSAWKHIR